MEAQLGVMNRTSGQTARQDQIHHHQTTCKTSETRTKYLHQSDVPHRHTDTPLTDQVWIQIDYSVIGECWMLLIFYLGYATMSPDSDIPTHIPGSFVRVVKRRTTANKKERRRTQSINNAYADLRDCIPNVPADTKLSKVLLLKLL